MEQTYVGEWKDGNSDGFGKIVFKERYGVYVGEFRRGRKHGWGVEEQPGKSLYVGEFELDKFQGQGTLTLTEEG